MAVRSLAAIAALAIPLCATGCVSTSEIVPVGRDSFMISATTRGGATMGQAPIVAAKAANQQCAAIGRHMIIRRTDSAIEGFNNSGINTLVFSCVDETDPEYQRPNLRKDPNVLVESR
jgi:hypothetical protein